MSLWGFSWVSIPLTQPIDLTKRGLCPNKAEKAYHLPVHRSLPEGNCTSV